MTTLNILTSRRNQITKTMDVIDIKNIRGITQHISSKGDLEYKGGLQVLGDFDEGRCIKLNMLSGRSYIICSVSNKVIDMANYIFDI